jgi:hypothetical protein
MLSNRLMRPLLVLVAVLALGALACAMPNPAAGPTAPCSVTTSKEAADRLVNRIKEQSQTPGQPFSVTATSEEMSSLFEQSLKQANDQQGSSDLKFENPVICFQSGKMSIFVTLTTKDSSLNALVDVTPAVSNDRLSVQIDKIQIGPIPVPESMSDEFAKQINESLNENLDRVKLTDIKIEEGQMTLSGEAK